MRNFKVLESFRFIGAILVAIGHFLWRFGPTDKISISFILVVDFFFVLSAFLTTCGVVGAHLMYRTFSSRAARATALRSL